MRGSVATVSLLVAFGLGSALGPRLNTPARAQQQGVKAARQAWEFKCEHYALSDRRIKAMSKLGRQGWELVAYGDGEFCMKRPM